MTGDRLGNTMDASWDVEFASFVNVYPETTGSTVAIYLTPPDGERLARLRDPRVFPSANPMLLAFGSRYAFGR